MFSYLLRAIGIAVLANSIGAYSARADDYPSRPVKIIAPFGVGGPTDLYARDIAEELRKALHQTFYIENRPGAGTTIGTDMVAKADPDGYMLLMVSGTQTVNETLYANKPYHLLQDLVPIAPLIETDLVLVEHPSVPAKNLSELLAQARAKPGTLNFGSSGPGSNYHMVIDAFADAVTALDDSVPTGTYVDMCSNVPVVDPEKITVPTLIMRRPMGRHRELRRFDCILRAVAQSRQAFQTVNAVAERASYKF